ncbi:MAG: hypothetical protein HOL51_07405 [Gemmatimonadetes bacterium]|jgi:ribonuclease P protein component|nr:hypothetical protein [Gemmatimonadota bacterium]MBT5325935.1 hypothetical protein [Gemmatimonadota bacterium]MBT5450403.1 hypothetical protein [Gemmatimonadota bacterium]MBT5800764.1 hypothetical protein [Gemmatimonadota bacterium]MBT6905598.1 hypothetical protein [Gemmatimonadota bacterium]
MAWIRGQCLWIRCDRNGSGGRSNRGAASRGQVFVVRRKLGNAVKRNRLKRRLRSICRSRPFFPNALVVFCQPSAVNAPYADLQRELDSLVSRLPTSPQ